MVRRELALAVVVAVGLVLSSRFADIPDSGDSGGMSRPDVKPGGMWPSIHARI